MALGFVKAKQVCHRATTTQPRMHLFKDENLQTFMKETSQKLW